MNLLRFIKDNKITTSQLNNIVNKFKITEDIHLQIVDRNQDYSMNQDNFGDNNGNDNKNEINDVK